MTMAPTLAMTKAVIPVLMMKVRVTTGTSLRGKPLKVCLRISIALTGANVLTADKKRAESGKGHESDDSDRPKKKAPAKANSKHAKGKGKA